MRISEMTNQKKTAIEIISTASTRKEPVKITVDGAVIKSISSPSTIQSVAQDKGINPQEVFVRVTLDYKGTEVKVSNKLRFLTKAGYQELLEAQKTKKPMKFVVDVANEFFYIERDVSVDDLFKEEITKPVDNQANLMKLASLVM
jgi:hypothetical protein